MLHTEIIYRIEVSWLASQRKGKIRAEKTYAHIKENKNRPVLITADKENKPRKQQASPFQVIHKVNITFAGVYLKGGSLQKSPPFSVILLAVLECMHIHIYCLMVNLASCFLDFKSLL